MNRILKLSALSVTGMSFALSAHLSAQVSTPIVGFQKITVPVGLSTAGFPLLNSDILKTSASSLSSNALSLSGETNVGLKLTAGEPYYIEIYSGDLKGDRFDVDTAATITAANGTVILSSSSSNNTYPVASIATGLNGATVALRKHITIGQIGSGASPALVGNNTASSADQIQLYIPSTKTLENYFLRGDGLTWRKVGTTATANNTIVAPGVGVFISKKSSPTEITISGAVRQNDFATPYIQGNQLVAPGFPIEFSPQGLGGTAANGWTGNNTASSADQIQIYNPTLKTFDNYFLRGDGTTWRKVGTTTAVTTSNLVSSDTAFFIAKRNADQNSVIVNPITP